MELFEPKPRRVKKVRETGPGGTEDSGRKRVAANGGLSFKWVSPGMKGPPDQIEMYGVDAMMREAQKYDLTMRRETAIAMLAAAIQFTEYKAPGKTPTDNQLRFHQRLRDRGFTVNIVDHK